MVWGANLIEDTTRIFFLTSNLKEWPEILSLNEVETTTERVGA